MHQTETDQTGQLSAVSEPEQSQVNKPNGTGFKRIYNATKCSIDGIKYAYQHESAFRQELMLACVLLPLACFVAKNPIELILLSGPVIALLVVECINSAIEAAIDRISTDIHPLSKQAKDLGSASVSLCILLVLLSWGAILIGRII